jgi:hypothetical protein
MSQEAPTEETNTRASPLQEALAGPKGALDAYLEVHNEEEVRRDILALTGMRWAERRMFAAMAAQGLATIYPQGGDFMEEHIAEGAVKIADALLQELAK